MTHVVQDNNNIAVEIKEIDYPEGRKKIDFTKYARKSVLDSDYSKVIKENCIIKEKGKPVLVYLVLNDFSEREIVHELKRLGYNRMNRSRGLISISRTFGYMPRVTMKRDFCTASSLAFENKKAHDMVCNLGGHINKYYKKYCGSMFEFHNEKSKVIKDEWKIEDTPFSSGIINKNNALKYHFDAGNIKGVYSNMVCFKKNCEGGYLVLPEFDIALEVANRSIVFFDGQDILHGVSPFRLTTMNGYRYTIVYYTLQQMWKCQEITEEIARIKNRKTEREFNRLKMMKGDEELKEKSGLLNIIKRDKDKTLKSKEYKPYEG